MHDIDWELLHRYLAGEATPDEHARFEAWRDVSADRQVFVRALLDATAEPPALPLISKRDQAETWARLERTIAGERGASLPALPARRFGFVLSSQRQVPAYAAAAAVIVLFGAAAVGVFRHAGGAATAEAAAHAEHVLQTPRGRRATFQLPDGTRVILGPASALGYAADYGRQAREVQLRGEAYFAVKHDERRPFTVRAADLVAQDLGTEFTVRAYPGDPRAVVVVRTGEVGIRAAAAPDATVQVVAAGELGELATGKPTVKAVELDPYFAWTKGRLVFDRAPLGEVLAYVSRWFDLDLRLKDSSLSTIPVTATLEHRPTADVLGNIAAAFDLIYAREGRVVYFRRPVLGR